MSPASPAARVRYLRCLRPRPSPQRQGCLYQSQSYLPRQLPNRCLQQPPPDDSSGPTTRNQRHRHTAPHPPFARMLHGRRNANPRKPGGSTGLPRRNRGHNGRPGRHRHPRRHHDRCSLLARTVLAGIHHPPPHSRGRTHRPVRYPLSGGPQFGGACDGVDDGNLFGATGVGARSHNQGAPEFLSVDIVEPTRQSQKRRLGSTI
jgi:hypothetical protein